MFGNVYTYVYVKTIKETKAMNLEGGVHRKDWRKEKEGKSNNYILL